MASENTFGIRAGQHSEYVLWTRMQAEAGQALEQIIERKEREREAGGGSFFWGVGNAPSKLIYSLARMAKPVEVIFSKMKSKPKAGDKNPDTTVVWRQYIDFNGKLRPLPPHALITSKGSSASGRKKTHFALECFSDKPLRINDDPEAFDPTAYRNAGGTGAPVGASQVTSLLVPVEAPGHAAKKSYSINMQAKLIGSYWVKLVDPLPLSESALGLIEKAGKESGDWNSTITSLLTRPEEVTADNGFPRLL